MKQDFSTPVAYQRTATVDSTVSYMGSMMSFLAKGEETGGSFALMEFRTKAGNEPPPHIHDWEHEMYYVLEGSIEFYCEDKVLTVGQGEVVFLPQGKPHAFYIRSSFVRTLILIQAVSDHPVGLDRYFVGMGEPATSMDLPSNAITHIMSDPGRVIRLGAENGIRILSPEEAAAALPQYPGFGANVAPARATQL
jgi:quercetin dioxygenase-like cupin family protein